jgi:hypothetical protein
LLQHFRNIHPGLNCADYEETSLVQSDTSFPRKCGFCSHRFKSRQDRIDHIADHFKKGKSMLDWNDDGDDNNDSDDMDDDDNNDDKPSGDGFFGGSSGSFGDPPAPQGPPGPKHNGSGNNDDSGPSYGPSGDYGVFQQFTELNSNDTGGQSSSPPLCANQSSIHKQGEEGVGRLETSQQHQRPTERPVPDDQQRQQLPPNPGEQYSTIIQRLLSALSPEHSHTTEVDKNTLAGDVVPRALISASDQMKMSSSELEDIQKLRAMISAHESSTEWCNPHNPEDSALQSPKELNNAEQRPGASILRRLYRTNDSRVPIVDENCQNPAEDSALQTPKEPNNTEQRPGASILRRLYRTNDSRVPGLDENCQSGVFAGLGVFDQASVSIEKPSPKVPSSSLHISLNQANWSKVDLLDHQFGRSVPNAGNNTEWNGRSILNIIAALQKVIMNSRP